MIGIIGGLVVWIECLGGAGGDREWGDRGSDIAETSCCCVPVYPCPRVKPWESRTMVAVAVQGAPDFTSHYCTELLKWVSGPLSRLLAWLT